MNTWYIVLRRECGASVFGWHQLMFFDIPNLKKFKRLVISCDPYDESSAIIWVIFIKTTNQIRIVCMTFVLKFKKCDSKNFW